MLTADVGTLPRLVKNNASIAPRLIISSSFSAQQVLLQVRGKRPVNNLVRAPSFVRAVAKTFCAEIETFVAIFLCLSGRRLRIKYDIETYPIPCPLR